MSPLANPNQLNSSEPSNVTSQLIQSGNHFITVLCHIYVFEFILPAIVIAVLEFLIDTYTTRPSSWPSYYNSNPPSGKWGLFSQNLTQTPSKSLMGISLNNWDPKIWENRTLSIYKIEKVIREDLQLEKWLI